MDHECESHDYKSSDEKVIPWKDLPKVALITGITGQDGSYLADFLLQKGYEVHGLIRRASTFNTQRVEHIYQSAAKNSSAKFQLHYGDMTDSSSLYRLVASIKPTEIYNLTAQSHVKISFDLSEYTANVDAVGTLRLLDAVKFCGLVEHTHIFQAATSEMYGQVEEIPQKETTPFHPVSPYGVAKLYSYWIVKNYREAYGMFAVNGILFNHESPNRGETFVMRKITRTVSKILLGVQDVLELGNIDVQRDWGYAKDYIEAMWMMMQHKVADDFVICTGEVHSVREFVVAAFKYINVDICWEGTGVNEVGKDKSTGVVRVRINPKFYRLTDADVMQGDCSKIRKELGWKPKHDFNMLVKEMMDADIALMKANPKA